MCMNCYYVVNNNTIVQTDFYIIKTNIVSEFAVITNEPICKYGICFYY